MKRLAVIYHSAQGHTQYLAGKVAEGARSVSGTEVHLLQAADLASAPDLRVIPFGALAEARGPGG